MKLAARIVATACKLALITAIIPALLACSNESSEPRTASLSLSELQYQLGFKNSDGSALSSPTTDLATTVTLSVAVGAMTVESRAVAEGPYTSQVPITDLEVQLEKDLRNSANFIVTRTLPTDEDAIDITIPEPGSRKFQIVAAAFKTIVETIEDLGERVNQDAVIYIGFDEKFLTTSSSGAVFELDGSGNETGDALTTITLNLIRSCLVKPEDPPKGCAQYDFSTSSFVVSDAVEITGVYLNGSITNEITTPYIVRSGGTGSCDVSGEQCSAASAATKLKSLLSGTLTSVLVRTTHKAAGNETDGCKLAGNTIAALEAACDTQDYFTPL